jgi:glutamate/tyrosine decarboxylase-like PLP-dependent enzyme
MTGRPDARPSAAARFSWHPEPGLIGIDDAATSRTALDALGREAWAAGLDYLFGEAFRRAMGEPTAYAELRRTFFGWTPDGATGAEGAIGAGGSDGSDGSDGSAGSTGSTGSTGSGSSARPDGSAGSTGSTGSGSSARPDGSDSSTGSGSSARSARSDGSNPGPAPAPTKPTTSGALLDEFRARLAPHQLNAYHPRSLSYFTPPPLMLSIVGELLAQFTNQGVDVWHAGPTGAFVEEEVGRWLCDLVGYGPESFAVLTSGGVMANFMALTVARDVHLTRLLGLDRPPRGARLEGVRMYASDQTHFSITRALDELGFPPETLHLVPADERFRLRGAPVAEAIAVDRAAGFMPWAIAAVAGSTNTGSVDRTGELADVAEREGLWLHVDAAYGGAARLSTRDAGRVPDLERADSVTVDPHKWFFQAYDIGALVVRRGANLLETFHRSPEYYRGGESGRSAPAASGAGPSNGGGPANGPETDTNDHPDQDGNDEQLNFYQRSMEGTRRWRALKLWMSWKHLGTEGLGRLIEANDDLAAYLARRVADADDFEALPSEPELSVVCFRHLPGGAIAAARLDPATLDRQQDSLQAALEASGDGWLSTTRLRGSTWLRAGIVNYLSTEADIDRILDDLRRLAADPAMVHAAEPVDPV